MSSDPIIIYVPGLKPKPEPEAHLEALKRCLLEGLRRIDPEVAAAVQESEPGFSLVGWTYDFYREHRDIALDIDDIDAVIQKQGASEEDIAIVSSWQRRLARWLFRVADLLPFLIPAIATEEAEIHLRDFNTYRRNENGVAEAARDKVKFEIRAAHEAGRPVLLLGHSMGSVIAYDALWELSRQEQSEATVDLFLTTGSPLGQNIVQRHLKGKDHTGVERYPANIRRWINIAAVGELTAIDMELQYDFAGMLEAGLVESIDDRISFNYYHMHGALNVHAEYGYLVNVVTAGVIRAWWREMTAA